MQAAAIPASAGLHNKSHAIKRASSPRKYPMSTVEHIPVEILLEIFSLACSENRIGCGDDGENSVSTVRVSSVCRLWHELCLRSPHLWATLAVGVFSRPPSPELDPNCEELSAHGNWKQGSNRRSSEEYRSLVELYLKRSDDHPLSLEIIDRSEQDPLVSFDNGLTVFICRERLRIMCLNIDETVLEVLCTAIGQHLECFPVLKVLKVNGLHDGREFCYKKSRLSNHIAEVSFEAIDFSSMNLPWHLITSADLTAGSMHLLFLTDNAIQALRLCELANAIACTERIMFKKLKSLLLQRNWLNEAVGTRVFDTITVPSLEKLEVIDQAWPLSDELERLNELDPPLKQFCLKDPHTDTKALKSALQYGVLKNITYFRMDVSLGHFDEYVTADDISFLFYEDDKKDDSTMFMHNLQDLAIIAYRIELDETIVDFLESHRTAGLSRPLERVCFTRVPGLFHTDGNMDIPQMPSEVVCTSKAVLTRLKTLRQNGLHIAINSDWSPLSSLKSLDE